MSRDKFQIRSLCRPIEIREGDYVNVMGLLHRIKEYQLKPFWLMSKDISEELLKDEDILAVEWLGDAGLSVIKTILEPEEVAEMLSDLLPDEQFKIVPFSRVEELGEGENPFYGVLDWRVEDDD